MDEGSQTQTQTETKLEKKVKNPNSWGMMLVNTKQKEGLA